MVNFGPLAAEIGPVVWGTPANFNRFHVLTVLLQGTVVVGVSQTLRPWTQGATYIWQGGHHVGRWPTFLVKRFFSSCLNSWVVEACESAALMAVRWTVPAPTRVHDILRQVSMLATVMMLWLVCCVSRHRRQRSSERHEAGDVHGRLWPVLHRDLSQLHDEWMARRHQEGTTRYSCW